MSFLAPLAFWLAAALVPALLILYFLKLRRREEPVSSTLLWKRAVQDLQVNAPFQRLRKNLLLFLQLLTLLFGVVALARPIVRTAATSESRLVLLIDRSASMNTHEGQQTRLELAKEQALRLVRTLNRTGSSWFRFAGAKAQTRVMVISFGDRANVITPGFTTNMSEVEDLIRGIQPSDGPTHMRERLELAGAYMAQTVVDITPETTETPAKLMLYSDGGIGDLKDLVLRNGTMEMIKIGDTGDNVGITALRTQRNYEKPETLEVFLEVRNYATEPATTDVTLLVDGQLANTRVRTISLDAAVAPSASASAEPQEPAATQAAGVAPAQPGESLKPASASLSFELELDRAAILEARLSRDDALPVDNRAFAVIPPPRKLNVLFVSSGNFYVESALNTNALPLRQVKYLTPAQYESAPASEIEADGQSLYDVVIIDRHDTARLPAGNYLFLGCAPRIKEIALQETIDRPFTFDWWDQGHAVLRYVPLEYVYVAKDAKRYETPPEAESLIEGANASMLFRYSHEGRQYMVLAFDPLLSNFVLRRSFPTFLYNVIRYLGAGGAGIDTGPIRPGDSLRIPLPAGTRSATLTRPDGFTAGLTPGPDGVAHYANTEQVGVYRVTPGIDGRDQFAINLEDDNESNVAPRTNLRFGGGQVVAQGEAIKTATPEVWRWFVAAALILILLEWYIYNRRVMI